MDFAVNETAARSVELEPTFTSSAEPGRGNESLEVSFSTVTPKSRYFDTTLVFFLSRKGKRTYSLSFFLLPSFPKAKIDNPVKSN